MTEAAASDLSNFSDMWSIFSLPFLFNSGADAIRVITDPRVSDILSKDAEANGFKIIGWWNLGERSIINAKHPVNTPEDLHGIKIRVMQNPIFIEMMADMGGNGIPIAFNELYTALQTGVVDGAENNPPSYLTQNHYEQAGYYSLTEHLIVPEIFVFSKNVWETLDEAQQQAIRECSKVATEKERELWKAMEDQAMAKLQEMGVQINEVDKQPFIEATAPVREKFGEQYAEILGKIEAVQ